MNTLSLKNIIRVGRFTIMLTVGIMLILSVPLSSIDAQDEPNNTLDRADSRDMLAYVSDEDHLMLYDPYDRTETTLLESVSSFVLGSDGRIAFTRLDETDTDLYVFDPATPALAPINISRNPTARHYPVAWSPDGQYLAFVSFGVSNDYFGIWIYQGYRANSRDQSLYVWDGEQVTNIMPDNGLGAADGFYVDWSHDGRLAFTIQHSWSNRDVLPEIYLWDGGTTINVSQNPEGFDSAAIWSRTGQLMFGSSRDEVSNIYIWDGISFRDGSPDVDSFVPLAPELQLRYPTWTNANNIIAFTLPIHNSPTGKKEIIWWDIEAETILRRYSIVSDNADSMLAEGGQVILSWHLASGTPSYYLDVENTEGEILFSEHVGEFSWSSAGYLAYCRRERDYRDWILSLWDGKDTWDVARTSYRPVQWQNGRNIFSCNNG